MGRLFPQTFAGAVYNVCIRGCKRYPWRTHVFAFKVDQIGPGGCSALRGRLQCTASEMGKRDTEIVSPILDKRKGRRDTPHMGHSSPLIYLLSLVDANYKMKSNEYIDVINWIS